MNSVFSKRSLSCAAVMAGVLIGASGLAATASAQTPVKLVLNWKYQGPQALFFVAEDKGYFKAEGLDVNIVDFAGGARAHRTRDPALPVRPLERETE